jgi:hypothetical protein
MKKVQKNDGKGLNHSKNKPVKMFNADFDEKLSGSSIILQDAAKQILLTREGNEKFAEYIMRKTTVEEQLELEETHQYYKDKCKIETQYFNDQ